MGVGAEDYNITLPLNLIILDNYRTGWVPKDRERQIERQILATVNLII